MEVIIPSKRKLYQCEDEDYGIDCNLTDIQEVHFMRTPKTIFIYIKKLCLQKLRKFCTYKMTNECVIYGLLKKLFTENLHLVKTLLRQKLFAQYNSTIRPYWSYLFFTAISDFYIYIWGKITSPLEITALSRVPFFFSTVSHILHLFL